MAVLHADQPDAGETDERLIVARQRELFDSRVTQNGDEQPMLVYVVEDVEPVERVIPTRVRFHLPYKINGPYVGAVYMSCFDGCLKATSVFAERKLDSLVGIPTGNNRRCNEVKSGAQIMDDITDDGREILRDILAYANLDKGGAWINARLKDKSIGFSLRELPGFSVKLADVLLGPR